MSQVLVNNTPLGVKVLRNHDIPTEDYWYWLGTGVLLGMAILFNLLFTVVLAYVKGAVFSMAPEWKTVLFLLCKTFCIWLIDNTYSPWKDTSCNIERDSQWDKKSGKEWGRTDWVFPSWQRQCGYASLSLAYEYIYLQCFFGCKSGTLLQKVIFLCCGPGRYPANEHIAFTSLTKVGAETAIKIPQRKGMILPFQPLTISFSDIYYSVDMPRVCLSTINRSA